MEDESAPAEMARRTKRVARKAYRYRVAPPPLLVFVLDVAFPLLCVDSTRRRSRLR